MGERPTMLVAGATGSIGGNAAAAMAVRGARVVLLGRTAEKLERRASALRERVMCDAAVTADVDTLTIDFADPASVDAAAEAALERYPAIDGLLLSVGLFAQGGPTVLPDGHELMFATNVLGPFRFTNRLLDRLEASHGRVAHVIARFDEELDWEDLESIRRHRSMVAFNRTKVCNRAIAGELARRYAGRITSFAFDPTFVLDRSDPDLERRWPSGLTGLMWRVMAIFRAKDPSVAGEPLAELMLSTIDPANGALYVLSERADEPDAAMSDRLLGGRLWDRLDQMVASTAPRPTIAKPTVPRPTGTADRSRS